MKLTPEQYQQIINSISDETVDLSFIREAEVEDIIHYAKENHPQIWDVHMFQSLPMSQLRKLLHKLLS